MPTVRPAEPTDAVAMGEVQVRAWRTAYRGIMRDAFLDGLSARESAAGWERAIADRSEDRIVRVAEDAGHVIGFAGGGPALRPRSGGVAELYVLNVDPSHWRRGAGSALIASVVDWAVSRDARQIVLWVVRENTRARGFYERRGWSWDGAVEEHVILGENVVECRYRRYGRDTPE